MSAVPSSAKNPYSNAGFKSMRVVTSCVAVISTANNGVCTCTGEVVCKPPATCALNAVATTVVEIQDSDQTAAVMSSGST